MKYFIATVLGILGMLSIAGELPAPVFQATFDHDFRATAGGQQVEGKHSSSMLSMETLSMLLMPGVKGKAAKIGILESANGIDSAIVTYPGSYLNARHGSVAFWLKPLDWDFKDTRFHVFFEARGAKEWLVIYKYGDCHDIFFLFGHAGNGGKGVAYVIAEAPASSWEKGEFHHITATWSEREVKLYVDGVQKSTVKLPGHLKLKAFDKFTAGPLTDKSWKNSNGYSLIDDLRIYDTILDGQQTESLYASYNYGSVDKSSIPVRIPLINLAKTADGKGLEMTFNTTRTTTTKRTGFPVEMTVRKNRKEVVVQTTVNSPSVEYRYVFDIAQLGDGDYEVELKPVRELPADKIENARTIFAIGEAPDSTDHTVPEPWTPVKLTQINGNLQVSTRMQSMEFSSALMPQKLSSENHPVLRAPMQFICNDQPVAAGKTPRISSQNDDACSIENTGVGDNVTFTSKCRVEFDGMMWFEITMVPKGKAAIQNAKVCVPLTPEVSSLYNRFAKDYYNFRGFNAGALIKTIRCNHYNMTSGDLPVLWMGNEERGLYYFSQDQAGRRLKNREETITLEPGKDGATLTINLVDYPFILEAPVTWRFGLQVTPVRPFVRNRTLWRPGHAVELWFPWAKVHNVPEARYAFDNYASMRDGYSGHGERMMFHYFAGFSASPENPGYAQHAQEWSITPPVVGTQVDAMNRQWRYIFVCAGCKSYRDYYVRQMARCLKDLKIQCLYFDNCWSWRCGNAAHGCGWTDEFGKKYLTANILGTRELAKELYKIQRKEYPYGMICRHISQIPEPTAVAFCDVLVDGECFMMNVGGDEHYYNVFKPDFFRASFLGNPIGMPSVYIAQFFRSYGMHFSHKLAAAKAGKLFEQAKRQRHFIGYILVHDTHAWPNFGIDMKPFYKIMDAAGIKDETRFWGYWKADNPIRKVAPAGERMMVSTYAAAKGYLAVVMNDTDQPQQFQIDVKRAGLGVSPQLTDAETGEKLSTMIPVNPRSFRLIQITK